MTLSEESQIQFPIGELSPTQKVELSVRLKKNREIRAVDFTGTIIMITPRNELLEPSRGVSEAVNAHSMCNMLLAEALSSMLGIRVR